MEQWTCTDGAGIIPLSYKDQALPSWTVRRWKPLHGFSRLRFQFALWRTGHLTVRSFQRCARIHVDGVVGAQTWVAFYTPPI